MKVWFVNHYALPPSASGITRHHDIATRLADRGVDVSIVASSFDHYSRSDRRRVGDEFTTEVVDGVRYCWVEAPPYGEGTVARSRNMVTFAARLASRHDRIDLPRPDVVVGSSPHLLAPVAARRVASKVGARFVLEVRDIWPESLVELGGPPSWHPAILALSRVERSLYRTADVVVSVLPCAAPHIRDRAGRDVVVEWIPNGAMVPPEPPPPVVREDGEPIEIVYAGTVGHANALDVVVDAASILERTDPGLVRWKLVGPGPERERLLARCAAEQVTTVEVPGPVAKVDVPGVLADADACLLHLMDSPVFRWGISPNKLFDYLGAARPVVFAVRAPNDPVTDSDAGVSIPPQDPEALAGAARRLHAAGPAERAAMGRRGFDYLRAHHDLDAIAVRYHDVLDGVVSGRGR